MIALAPATSSRVEPARAPVGGEAREASPMSTTPAGTLMKNAHRQPGPGDESARDDADRSGGTTHGTEDAEGAVASCPRGT